MLPSGSDEDPRSESAPNDHHQQRSQRRSSGNAVPSREACLQAIARLSGLVAMGILKPAQANSIRASFETILHCHERDRDRAGQAAQLPNEDVIRAFDLHPDLIDLLAPVLSEDQLQMLVNRTKARSDGQA
jgi:hypothetical protein